MTTHAIAPMIGTPALRSRGWTDSLIRRFLPDPDSTYVNPHYRSGPPCKLYSTERVEAIERTPAFLAAMEKASKRKLGAAAAVETRRQATERMLESLTITVQRLDRETAVKRAVESYNERQKMMASERGHCDPFTADTASDQGFLDRITVNYVRHHLTAYDDRLDNVKGMTGADDARMAIAAKVFDAISKVYPWLQDECERQLSRREKAEFIR